MVEGRWLDLASLMLTSADLIFSKASEKGRTTFVPHSNQLLVNATSWTSYTQGFSSFVHVKVIEYLIF